MSTNNFPKLHNAMWPGLVGKGSPGAEPCLDLDTMLDLTAKAEVNGVKFDGVDIFLFEPHINIDASDDDLKRIAEKISEMPHFVAQKPDASGIYRFLKSMESKGLVVSTWATPGTGRDAWSCHPQRRNTAAAASRASDQAGRRRAGSLAAPPALPPRGAPPAPATAPLRRAVVPPRP